MKYTITAQAVEPEDVETIQNMLRVNDIMCAMQEFDNYLRSRLKYESLSEEVHDALQLARDQFYEELKARSINLWG